MPCDQCGQIIEPSQVEYLLEAEGEEPAVRLHVHCYAGWRDNHSAPTPRDASLRPVAKIKGPKI